MAMIGGTRHDCILGSAGVLRLGVAEAVHYTRHRLAFGRPPGRPGVDDRVLADLALEYEGAVAGALRLSRAIEEAAAGNADAAAFRRIAAPVLKYWVCKRAPGHSAEALECLGGAGYMEDSRLPRAYREAPLMSIWEGSGNVQALDVLRALTSEAGVVDALLGELKLAQGGNRLLDAAAVGGGRPAGRRDPEEGQARAFVGLAARTLCRLRCWSASPRRGGRRLLRLPARPPLLRRLRRPAAGGRSRRDRRAGPAGILPLRNPDHAVIRRKGEDCDGSDGAGGGDAPPGRLGGPTMAAEGLSDEALLAGLTFADPETGRAFVQRFQGRVFGLALAILKNPFWPRTSPRRRFCGPGSTDRPTTPGGGR